jgi:hypothetical protein
LSRQPNYIFFLLLSGSLYAQENIHLQHHHKDTLCLSDCFQKAHWETHTRTFFMSTVNEGALKDDYAMATGAGIGVITKPVYGFQAGLSGFFTFKLFSSRINRPDTLTQKLNRYEAGLFDIENPNNHNDMDRLEELYLRYSHKKFSIAGGRMNLNTPFINPQDGRMRPTLAHGIWLNTQVTKKISWGGGWINSVSPRSTVRWVSLAESIGMYSTGIDIDGNNSEYKGNIEGCSGMAIANLNYALSEKFRFIFWNGFLENVMNTSIAEYKFEKRNSEKVFYHDLMFIRQDALNNGGNQEKNKSYFGKDAQSNSISARAGMRIRRKNININYTHITGDGRYLMPREWGRESFYTFLPRERLEGAGNVNALMVKYESTSANEKLRATLAYGYYSMPDVANYRLNKYGLPSYHHLYMETDYTFDGFFKGMQARIIVSSKFHGGERPADLKYIYNKVNMVNFNVILDYKI